MKKNLLVLSLLSLSLIGTRVIAQNPIPNPGFENWTGTEPDDWLTNNSSGNFVTKVSPGNSGSFAARGDVQNIFGFDVPPLIGSEGDGFDISQSYSNLYFYYKFNQIGTAELVVGLDFYDSLDSLVGYGIALISSPATNFTLGAAPISLFGTPIRCLITITMIDPNGGGFPQVGNYFIIDDLSFDNTIGIPSVASADYLIESPVPNPSTDFTTISYTVPKATNVDLKICDLFGRELKTIHEGHSIAGENLLNLDVHNLSDGTYFLVLTSQYGMLQRKLIVAK